MEGDTEGGVNRVRLLYNHIWEAVITAWAQTTLSWSTTDPEAQSNLTVLHHARLTAPFKSASQNSTPMTPRWCCGKTSRPSTSRGATCDLVWMQRCNMLQTWQHSHMKACIVASAVNKSRNRAYLGKQRKKVDMNLNEKVRGTLESIQCVLLVKMR